MLRFCTAAKIVPTWPQADSKNLEANKALRWLAHGSDWPKIDVLWANMGLAADCPGKEASAALASAIKYLNNGELNRRPCLRADWYSGACAASSLQLQTTRAYHKIAESVR